MFGISLLDLIEEIHLLEVQVVDIVLIKCILILDFKNTVKSNSQTQYCETVVKVLFQQVIFCFRERYYWINNGHESQNSK